MWSARRLRAQEERGCQCSSLVRGRDLVGIHHRRLPCATRGHLLQHVQVGCHQMVPIRRLVASRNRYRHGRWLRRHSDLPYLRGQHCARPEYKLGTVYVM
jgi:hypothetical protein